MALECNNNVLLRKARRQSFLYLQERNLELLLNSAILRITVLIYSITHLQNTSAPPYTPQIKVFKTEFLHT